MINNPVIRPWEQDSKYWLAPASTYAKWISLSPRPVTVYRAQTGTTPAVAGTAVTRRGRSWRGCQVLPVVPRHRAAFGAVRQTGHDAAMTRFRGARAQRVTADRRDSLRSALRARLRRPPAAAPTRRRVIPPSVHEIVVADTASRQRLLADCDRSPSLFRLDTISGSAAVQVSFRGEVVVGMLGPDALAADFARLIAKAAARGDQVWVHGQVQRRGVDLCVVLRCPPPREIR